MTARQKREILILAIVIIVAAGAGMAYRQLTSGGAGDTGAPAKPRKTAPTDIVARVEGQEITRATLDKYYGVTLGLHGLDAATVPDTMQRRLMASSLKQIIDERVLATAAASRGVEVTEEKVAEMVEQAKKAFASEEEFADNLNNDLGLTVDELKEMLYYQRLAEEVRQTFADGLEVADSEIDQRLKEYEGMLKDHPGGEVALPSRDEVKAEVAFGKADQLYTEWLDGVVAAANVEIVDKSLIEEAQPQMPEGHPPMDQMPQMPPGHPSTDAPQLPEGHPPVEPPADSGAGA
jgi:hypothetical protein